MSASSDPGQQQQFIAARMMVMVLVFFMSKSVCDSMLLTIVNKIIFLVISKTFLVRFCKKAEKRKKI
jgi:hypothetical protein